MNHKIMTLGCALGLALSLAPGSASAGSQINVKTNAPAVVYFDDEEIGQAPLSIRDIEPGFHRVLVKSSLSGEARSYELYSPRKVNLVKEVDIQFEGGSDAALPPPPGEYDGPAGPAVAGEVGAAPPPDSAAAENDAYRIGRQAEKERQQRRLRNTLLGAAVANEVLNKGGSKGTVRGVTLGGALLNELFKR